MTAYITWYVLSRLVVLYLVHCHLKTNAKEIDDFFMATIAIRIGFTAIPILSDILIIFFGAVFLTSAFLQAVFISVGSYYRETYSDRL